MKKIKCLSLLFISLSIISCSSNVPSPLQNELLVNENQVNTSSTLSKTKAGFYSTGILKIKNQADIQKTLTALKELKLSTSKEKGNLDFVILQDKADLTRIIIWEHFLTEADFNKHLSSEHLKKFLSLNLVEFVVGYPAQIVA